MAPPVATSVVVVGGRAIAVSGEGVDLDTAAACARLAVLAEADLLEVAFAATEGGLACVGATSPADPRAGGDAAIDALAGLLA